MKKFELYTDEELIRLICKDEVIAFEAIYNRYWDKLFNAAYSRLKQKESCEELVQEIFVTLWERRYALNFTTGLSQYLFTAVKYKVIDFYRKQLSGNQYLQAATNGNFADNSAEENIFLNDLKAQIEKAVMQLPGKCRSVYELSRLEHKSNKEIAAILNISEKTVEGHLTKALRALRLAVGCYILIFERIS